jgi:hypothetical protein
MISAYRSSVITASTSGFEKLSMVLLTHWICVSIGLKQKKL